MLVFDMDHGLVATVKPRQSTSMPINQARLSPKQMTAPTWNAYQGRLIVAKGAGVTPSLAKLECSLCGVDHTADVCW